MADLSGDKLKVLKGVHHEPHGRPAHNPLPEFPAGLDQRVSVGVGRPAGRSPGPDYETGKIRC
jgi:hypothetical protein